MVTWLGNQQNPDQEQIRSVAINYWKGSLSLFFFLLEGLAKKEKWKSKLPRTSQKENVYKQ